MQILESSLARLIFAIVTVGMALHVMKGQDEVWLGVLAAMVGAWLLLGLGEATRRDGRNRRFWGAFTIVAGLSLAWSFGPWSDADVRGTPPTSGDLRSWREWDGKLLLATRAVFPLMTRGLRPPVNHFTIETRDRAGRPAHRVSVRMLGDFSPSAEELGLDLNQSLALSLLMNSKRPKVNSALKVTRTFQDAVVFLHGWHLSFALMLGWLAGGVVLAASLFRRFARRSHEAAAPSQIRAPEA